MYMSIFSTDKDEDTRKSFSMDISLPQSIWGLMKSIYSDAYKQSGVGVNIRELEKMLEGAK